MTEEWKTIEGYEDYWISNLGNVKSFKNGKEQILKPFKNNGYLAIDLRKNKNRKCFKIHRLVASAFIPNPNNLQQVNHKDENTYNNCVNNLEWCTHTYNNNYGTRNKRIGEKHKMKILQYTIDGVLIKEWDSMVEASKYYNISKSLISECCNGKYRTAGGYEWKKAS